MSATQRNASLNWFYLSTTASLLGDIAAVASYVLIGNIPLAAALHAGVIVVAAAQAQRASDSQHHERLSLFLLPMILAAGPFGSATCLVAAIIYALSSQKALDPSEWIEGLFERESDSEIDRLYDRIVLGRDDFEEAENVEPFCDILTSGTVHQKQMAAAKIARYFSPRFAPLLMRAANDSNAAVRVQASTALAKIERDFMTRYIKLENALKVLADHDPSKLRLADLYDDYAHAGLLDDNNKQELRLKAIEIYKAYLAARDNPQVRVRLGRLYLRQNRPEEARDCLEPVIRQPNAPHGALYWYMEALFCLKQFGHLRTLAGTEMPAFKRISGATSIYDEIENVPHAWQAHMVEAVSKAEA